MKILFRYTPLKISIRTADETSIKLPVTDLEQAPLRGAVSNLHWYKNVKQYLFQVDFIQIFWIISKYKTIITFF